MEEEQLEPKKSYKWLWIVIIIILVAAGILIWYYLNSKTLKPQESADTAVDNAASEEITRVWTEEGAAVAGKFCDADVVDLGNGTYRMYYSAEPETANFQGQLYSATSTDGINWTQESGVRLTGITFPDAVKLDDGTWRMYFQNDQVIKSATSTDGLTWTKESGTRVDSTVDSFTLSQVAAPTTIKLSDGTFLMVYSGTVDQPYDAKIKTPNSDTRIFLYATSVDGITWTKKGLALDSRNSTMQGFMDGPDLINWDDSSIRLYFWGYSGVYFSNYSNGIFSTPEFAYSNSDDTSNPFPPNPPGDPTLININNVWYMYYGLHTKGIYYADYN